MPKRRKQRKHVPKVLLEGELLVTGTGEIIIEECLKPSRALSTCAFDVINVKFVGEPQCPPCAPFGPDELKWNVFARKKRHGSEELFLRISWQVSSSRTIAWRVFEVD